LIGILSALSPRLTILAATIFAAVTAYGTGYVYGSHNGYQQATTEQFKADIKAQHERAKDDAKLRALNDYDFCVVSLRRRGMPVHDCDVLRGLPQE